jgi:oligoendopeptidase F
MASIPLRAEISDKDKWDLSPLFKNDEEWHKLYNELEQSINEYKKFMGTLSDSFETFKDVHIQMQTKKIH